jgi:NFU1 iron-sulfur cluster scaffold homolog, mitochondrial
MLMVEDVDLTPNPHALKFILNQKLLNTETRQYPDKNLPKR